jgi:hypothetical protein
MIPTLSGENADPQNRFDLMTSRPFARHLVVRNVPPLLKSQ